MTALVLVLVAVLAAAVVVGVGIGLIARMSPGEIVGQCAAMCATTFFFWGLVAIL